MPYDDRNAAADYWKDRQNADAVVIFEESWRTALNQEKMVR